MKSRTKGRVWYMLGNVGGEIRQEEKDDTTSEIRQEERDDTTSSLRYYIWSGGRQAVGWDVTQKKLN